MCKPKLIIMVGNIASGKTTWIKQNRMVERGYVVLSKDDIRRMLGAGDYLWNESIEPIVHESLIDMLCNFMQQGVNIIYDETNMDIETRKAFLGLTKKHSRLGYDYKTMAVVMPKISIKHAIERRCGLNKSTWGFSREVWEGVYKRKNSVFEMPTKEEGFDEILEIK